MSESATSYLFQGKRPKIIFTVSICLALLNITGCDFVYNKIYPDFKANKEKAVVEAPPFARDTSPAKISIEKVRDVAQKIETTDTDFTVNPIAVNDVNLTDLQEPQQTQSHLLFKDIVLNDEDRFARLENKVQKLSDTLNKMEPSITKLIDIESELDALTFQLEKLINQSKAGNNNNQNIQSTSYEAPIKPVVAAPSPNIVDIAANNIAPQANKNASPLIQKIRVGDHKDKARIVIETAQKLAYDLQYNGNNLRIMFPDGQLSDHANLSAHGSQLIKTIKRSNTNDGTTALDLKLNKAAKVIKQFRMAPDKDVRANQRIVIDLAR